VKVKEPRKGEARKKKGGRRVGTPKALTNLIKIKIVIKI